jgi:hypothetical protein
MSAAGIYCICRREHAAGDNVEKWSVCVRARVCVGGCVCVLSWHVRRLALHDIDLIVWLEFVTTSTIHSVCDNARQKSTMLCQHDLHLSAFCRYSMLIDICHQGTETVHAYFSVCKVQHLLMLVVLPL